MAEWEGIVAKKQKQLQQAIPAEWRLPPAVAPASPDPEKRRNLVAEEAVRKCGLLSEAELQITEEHTATRLLDRIARKELKAVDVAVAFCKRAAIAHQLTTCLTEMFFDRGIERAKWLDKYLEENGRVYGPLHGLPISLKDMWCVEGIDASAGWVALLKETPTSNSAIVDLLLDAGAVLYAKTNIPQSLMTADSDNNIYGRTLNPLNTALTAGGSTGGESALIALGGSVLGLGSDIAGSVRIPAACCGLYAFKPSPGRVPFGGPIQLPLLLLPGLEPVAGPLAASVADLELFMRTVADADPWRYENVPAPLPWQRLYHAWRPLTVGLLPEDPDYPLHPPVRRALADAAAALERAGHRVVRLPADPARSVERGQRIAYQYLGVNRPAVDLIAQVGEPLVPSVAVGAHPFVKGPPVCAETEPLALLDALQRARSDYTDRWRSTWLQHDLDVVLGPVAQNTAVAHDTWGLPPYTIIWNLTAFPSTVIPFGKVSKALDPEPTHYQVPFQPEYDPELLDGAPCALQVVAPRLRDEFCLWASSIIDRDLRQESQRPHGQLG